MVTNSFNHAFINKHLASEQGRAVINLIPKLDKDTTKLKNWRPISLLNSDYKIAAKSIASRLKSVLNILINDNQTGFMKGSYIGENIRLVLDLIQYTTDNDLPGFLFLLDFEKAFDTISWNFINRSLSFFNFGCDFKRWINTFYSNVSACVMNNGHSSVFLVYLAGSVKDAH